MRRDAVMDEKHLVLPDSGLCRPADTYQSEQAKDDKSVIKTNTSN